MKQNPRGQSLIQVLISIAILGIVFTAFTTLMTTQQNLVSHLSQKLASLDLERIVTNTLLDPGICNFMVTNPALPAFDPLTVGTSSSPVFILNRIPLSADINSQPAAEVSSTVPASPLSRSVYISSITIADLACTPSPCTPLSNQFAANIILAFDASRLLVSLQPLKFPITLNTSGPGNSQTVSSCLASSTPLGAGSNPQVQIFIASGSFTVPPGVTDIKVTAVGGGGGRVNAAAGGNGGAGQAWISGLTPGSNIPVTVGTGGAFGGVCPAGAAGDGTSSSFGGFLSATGGTGARCGVGAGTSGTFTTTATQYFSSPGLVSFTNYGTSGPLNAPAKDGVVIVEW
jgi:Tfp pilus assembly protein PilV